MKQFILILFAGLVFTQCTTVDSGSKGVEVSWGGETNMTEIYPEGVHYGLHWLVDDMIEYDCREKTVVEKLEFNDLNSMSTPVEIAVDYSYDPAKVNRLHTQIADIDAKLNKTIKSAAKEVIPSYSAVDLNLHKRQEAEARLGKILAEEFPAFFCKFARVQITDVDLPKEVAAQATKTAEQIGKNKLAAEMKSEQEGKAAALVAIAKGRYEAAQYDAKSAELLSTPSNLKLKELEVQMKWAENGVSPYGENNVFGGQTPTIFRQQTVVKK